MKEQAVSSALALSEICSLPGIDIAVSSKD